MQTFFACKYTPFTKIVFDKTFLLYDIDNIMEETKYAHSTFYVFSEITLALDSCFVFYERALFGSSYIFALLVDLPLPAFLDY